MNTLVRRTVGSMLLLVTLVAAGVLALMIPVSILNIWSVTLVDNEDMAPTVPKGSVVISEKAPTREIKQGDIVTLNATGEAAISTVSRVTAVSQNEDKHYFFQIQGDNNDLPDSWSYRTDASSYRLLATIPLVGYAGLALNNMVGAMILLFAVTVLVWVYVLFFYKAPVRKPSEEIIMDHEDAMSGIQTIFAENGVTLVPWEKKTLKQKLTARRERLQAERLNDSEQTNTKEEVMI